MADRIIYFSYKMILTKLLDGLKKDISHFQNAISKKPDLSPLFINKILTRINNNKILV